VPPSSRRRRSPASSPLSRQAQLYYKAQGKQVNKSHTISRLPPSRATETRAKHAALQRCGSRDIDAEYWGVCVSVYCCRCGWAAAGGGVGRRAQAASTRRHSTQAATLSRIASRSLKIRCLRFRRHVFAVFNSELRESFAAVEGMLRAQG
jgi:hypothetical protein